MSFDFSRLFGSQQPMPYPESPIATLLKNIFAVQQYRQVQGQQTQDRAQQKALFDAQLAQHNVALQQAQDQARIDAMPLADLAKNIPGGMWQVRPEFAHLTRGEARRQGLTGEHVFYNPQEEARRQILEAQQAVQTGILPSATIPGNVAQTAYPGANLPRVTNKFEDVPGSTAPPVEPGLLPVKPLTIGGPRRGMTAAEAYPDRYGKGTPGEAYGHIVVTDAQGNQNHALLTSIEEHLATANRARAAVTPNALEQITRQVAEKGVEGLTVPQRQVWDAAHKPAATPKDTSTLETIRRQVALNGVESLTPGQRVLWNEELARRPRNPVQDVADAEIRRQAVQSGAEARRELASAQSSYNSSVALVKSVQQRLQTQGMAAKDWALHPDMQAAQTRFAEAEARLKGARDRVQSLGEPAARSAGAGQATLVPPAKSVGQIATPPSKDASEIVTEYKRSKRPVPLSLWKMLTLDEQKYLRMNKVGVAAE